jgi:hypothetical protein
MSDNPIPQPPQDNAHAQNKETSGVNIKGTQTKGEVGKRNISATFGGLFVLFACCLHGLFFWLLIVPGLMCLAFCLYLELKHLGYKRTHARSWGLILFVIGLLCSSIYWFQYKSSQLETILPVSAAESKSIDVAKSPASTGPQLTFSLIGDKQTDFLELTNDVLVDVPFNGVSHEPLGAVLFPIQLGQTNFLFRLGIHTTEFAELLEVIVSVPAVWGIVADSKWTPIDDVAGMSKGYAISNDIIEPQKMMSWVKHSKIDLLAGDAAILPGLLLTNIIPFTLNPSVGESKQIGSISISAKAKGLEGHLEFRPFFLPVSNGYSHKPIVVTAFSTNNNRLSILFPFPPLETNEPEQ